MNQYDFSSRQLKAYEVLQKIKMAWVALFFILILFAIGLFCFLYAIFRIESQGIAKVLLGGIDTLLGWALKAIITNLFPPPQTRTGQSQSS